MAQSIAENGGISCETMWLRLVLGALSRIPCKQNWSGVIALAACILCRHDRTPGI
jgi:hypothetical protein